MIDLTYCVHQCNLIVPPCPALSQSHSNVCDHSTSLWQCSATGGAECDQYPVPCTYLLIRPCTICQLCPILILHPFAPYWCQTQGPVPHPSIQLWQTLNGIWKNSISAGEKHLLHSKARLHEIADSVCDIVKTSLAVGKMGRISVSYTRR